MFTWVAVVIDITGINYSANAFAYFTRRTPQRFVRGLPYLVVILPIVLLININIATVRRFKDSGSEVKDTVRDIIYNYSTDDGQLKIKKYKSDYPSSSLGV